MDTHILIRKQAVSVDQGADFTPVRVVEIEVGGPLPDISAYDERIDQRYQRALCLVRLHTQPLGQVELQLGEQGVSGEEYAPHIWRTLSVEINDHLQQDGLSMVTRLDMMGLSGPAAPVCLEEREQFFAHAPFVSVIVPTRDRPAQIRNCLESLMNLHYPRYEIIIVDNAPTTNATADFIQHTYADIPQVRYTREDRPGRCLALNRGIMAAKGEILAFTDDDVLVDRYWLVELARGFGRADDVACVTGLVLPLELETPAQLWFEEYGGFSRGLTRRVFDMKKNHPRTPLYPYTAGRFGTGANMAFRTSFLRSVDGFDIALGTGSPAQSAEDLAAFFQVVKRGYSLVYEPAALLYHLHRRDYIALRKQVHSYGIGLTAYLTKILLDTPWLLFDIIAKLPHGLFFALNSRSPKNSKKSPQYPKELTTFELKGMLYGPLAYVHSRWVMRNLLKDFAPIKVSHTSSAAKKISALGLHSRTLE